MKAVRMHGLGGPEVLHYEDAPDPVPRTGEVLRARARSVAQPPRHLKPGGPSRTIAGPPCRTSSATMRRVRSLRSARASSTCARVRVIANPGYGCGHCRHCLAGRETLCRSYRILGYELPGTYAEYVALPAQNVVAMPENLDFAGAGSIGPVSLTAWHMLVTLAKVQPGETVLVLGAGYGVGVAAIQIARLFGARVIATASGPEKSEKARLLGVDETIGHAQ